MNTNRKFTLELSGRDIWSLACDGKIDRNFTVVRLSDDRYRAIAGLNSDLPVSEHFASWVAALKWLTSKSTGLAVR